MRNKKYLKDGSYRPSIIVKTAYKAIKKCSSDEGYTISISHECIKEEIENKLGSEFSHLNFNSLELSAALGNFSKETSKPYAIITYTISRPKVSFKDGITYLTSDLDTALERIEELILLDYNQLEVTLYKYENDRRNKILHIRSRPPNKYGCNSCYFFSRDENFCRLYNVINPKKNPNLGYNCSCYIYVSDEAKSHPKLEEIVIAYSQRCQSLFIVNN